MNEKYLPIGTVVLLKNGKKRIMITGFCIKLEEDITKTYDYCGCLYPEGVISSMHNLVFNHDSIQKIYAYGYSDDEDKKYRESIKEKLKEDVEVFKL